jgi:hypothetical protein
LFLFLRWRGLRQLVLAVVEVLAEVVGFERLGAGVLGFALGFGFSEAGGCEVFARRVRGTRGEVEVGRGMLGSIIASGDRLSHGSCWCWGAVFVFEAGCLKLWYCGLASVIRGGLR